MADDPWVGGAADEMTMFPNETVGEGVERLDGRVRLSVRHEDIDTGLHLVRCTLRERQRQDLRGTSPPTGDEPGDATGDDLRLSGAGPSDDEERPVAVRDGLALPPIEPGEEAADVLDRDGHLDRRAWSERRPLAGR